MNKNNYCCMFLIKGWVLKAYINITPPTELEGLKRLLSSSNSSFRWAREVLKSLATFADRLSTSGRT